MRVAILGAGPSGLMAAWAAHNVGCDVALYDTNPRYPDGRTAGVYYLHERCDLPVDAALLALKTLGTADGYRRKLYGADYRGPISFPEDVESAKPVLAWDGQTGMRYLWDKFGDRVTPYQIDGMHDLIDFADHYQRVVSTIPLPVYYSAEERSAFRYAKAFIEVLPLSGKTHNYMVYNGEERTPWYRESCVFGVRCTEYPVGVEPDKPLPFGALRYEVVKVLPLDAPVCPPRHNVLFTGRYGAWDKRCLTHTVYRRVKEWIVG